METVKYCISVLSYTEVERARECVEAILKCSCDFRLILTANGPIANEYFDSVKRWNPDIVTVIKNPQNEGFIGPNNHAFDLCKEPYFILVNDDLIVSAGWLEKLEEPFLTHPKAVLSGPRGTCQSLDGNLDGRPGGAFEYLEGSCLMCKVATIRAHSKTLFSDYLTWIYAEDSDLSLRMRRLGYTLHQVDFPHKHVRCATTGKMTGVRPNQLKNQKEVARRFAHYLKVRRFDHPIVVRRGGAIGDVMLTTPIIRALHFQNPLCQISVQTRHPEIFLGMPEVTDASKHPAAMRDRAVRLIDLDMSYEKRLNTNIVDAYADAAMVPRDKWELSLYLDGHERAFANFAAIVLSDKWCAIHMGTSWPGKMWLPDRWSELAKELRRRKFKLLLVGKERGVGGPVHADLDLRGATNIHQLAAVLIRCDLFVGIDSMPMHCANAVGLPVVALFGVTLPEFVLANQNLCYPVVADRKHAYTGLRHQVRGKTMIQCKSNPMETITVDMVSAAVNQATQTPNAIQKRAAKVSGNLRRPQIGV